MNRINRIRINHMKPDIIFCLNPVTVSWNVADTHDQKAYRIKAIGDKGLSFDSGVVYSADMHCHISCVPSERETVNVSIASWSSEDEIVDIDNLFCNR